MADSANIQKVGALHNEIMDYMLANPTAKKGDIAKHFSLSRSWLSIVINSHAFQERLAEKQEELFITTVIPIREKMLGIADAALDKVADSVDVMDRGEALETADKILNRLGWGTKADAQAANNTAIQQNTYYVGNDVLEKARERFGSRRQEEVIEGEITLIEETHEIQIQSTDGESTSTD